MHFPVIQFFSHRSCDYHHMLYQVHVEAVPILLALFQLQSLPVDVLMQFLEIQIVSSAERMSIHFVIKSWWELTRFLKFDLLALDQLFLNLFLHCTSGVCPIMAYLLHCQHLNNKRGWRWWKTIERFDNWRENPEPMEKKFFKPFCCTYIVLWKHLNKF